MSKSYYLFYIDDIEIGAGDLITIENKTMYFNEAILLSEYNSDSLPVFFDIYYLNNKYYDCYFSKIHYKQITIKDGQIFICLNDIEIIFGYKDD
mgnify:CR=1 FL=1